MFERGLEDKEIRYIYIYIYILRRGGGGLALECLGLIWAPTWLPLTWPWAPWGLHGVSLGSLATPWTPFGVPWRFPCGSLRVPWGALGCPSRFSQICRKLDAQFRANVSIRKRLRIEYSLPEFSRALLATPLPHAGGQDDVSLKETPSNKLTELEVTRLVIHL